jgi:DNA-binding NtrC family response regulator
VRIVAATNTDLLQEIEGGNVRMDLYHRLSVILIHVPSLIERTDDIPVLAQNFCEEICSDYNMSPKKFSEGAIAALKMLPWTGNIRELRNVVERLIILGSNPVTSDDVENFVRK